MHPPSVQPSLVQQFLLMYLLAASIIICFLNMVHADINVRSRKERNMFSETDPLKLLVSEIINSLLSM